MLRQKLTTDQIQALKNHDQDRLSILRYILAQIKNKEIDTKSELKDEEVIAILRKITKELNESLEAFKKGQREDLLKNSQKQLEVVSSYLPKEMLDEDLKKEIEKIIEEYKKNLPAGRQVPKAIIGICVNKLKSQADPSRIVKILQPLIS